MKIRDFTVGLQDEMELDSSLELSTNIKELDEWDSLNAMVLSGYVNENFGVTLSKDDISNITTVESLIKIIGIEKFEE
jgi:acyl carrier protein